MMLLWQSFLSICMICLPLNVAHDQWMETAPLNYDVLDLLDSYSKSILPIVNESWHWFEWPEFKCPEKFALSLSELFLGCARFEILGTIREPRGLFG